MTKQLEAIKNPTYSSEVMGLTMYVARKLLIMALWNEVKKRRQNNFKTREKKFNGFNDYWQLEE